MKGIGQVGLPHWHGTGVKYRRSELDQRGLSVQHERNVTKTVVQVERRVGGTSVSYLG